MVLSIHSSAAFQSDSGWPSYWPPVKLPPPSPLSAAATTLWSPKLGSNVALAINTSDPLYSTQLATGGQAGSGASQGGFQMAFLDQRIALMRFDASHATQASPANPAPVAVAA
ncbi:MAG TPA: hypothetical protein VKA46_11995 [Gemmataceae bacterium]|nr:hypothetical protein [Gemmataceae bacterium]